MSSKHDAPGFNRLKHNWGLASRPSDIPEKPTPEKIELTPERKSAMKFGIDPGFHDAGRDKKNVQKDQRTERRTDIENRLGISLGDKPAQHSSSSNITRAFGGTNTR
ncbi:hypothetical protein [uncultured Ruegeria sp.]|uniref:hypothetical protein n=1 Tax=uncultured Ruegeria sp. TaxID=259304 RepID=UPI00263810C2|nr:hypothetical protein [uncultured Ruegeria sp.]